MFLAALSFLRQILEGRARVISRLELLASVSLFA